MADAGLHPASGRVGEPDSPAGGIRSTHRYPKAPRLSWHDFAPGQEQAPPSIDRLPHVAATTSGRAALLAALRQIAPPPGSTVLVPTYHCPTMVAPVLKAGLQEVFFPIDDEGLPRLDAIPASRAAKARVMFVAHYFGLPRSLAAVAQWCRDRGITLVEDCAHSFFGRAGERSVGGWGDFATASLSKFFPVPEAGLLASKDRPLAQLRLKPQGWRAQIKGVVDILEYAHQFGGLAGVNHVLAPVYLLKNRSRPAAPSSSQDDAPALTQDLESMMSGCDMWRTHLAPTAAAMGLFRVLPRGRQIGRRRTNYAQLAKAFEGFAEMRPLMPSLPDDAVPYVMPLLFGDAGLADRIYALARTAGLPVFRWDRVWPGTPSDAQDAGTRWNRRVVQLLCHQTLEQDDVARVADTIVRLVRSA